MMSTKRIRIVKKTSISSAEMVACNIDLITEILVRLPVRSLMKFKCISKHWLSLISDPDFSLRKNLHPIPTSDLFLDRSSYLMDPEVDFVNLNSTPAHAPFRSLTFFNDPSGIKIRQSCNGLLLCCSLHKKEPKRNYYIYNPTTKNYTVLPRNQASRKTIEVVLGVSLAFDPSKSPHYKVIYVCNGITLQNRYQIQVYSSKTDTWRLCSGPFTNSFHINFNRSVFWNGAIHWISDWGISLCFDVDQERCKEMPMPLIPNGMNKRWVRYFGESQGHLHLIENYGPCTIQFDVYEMERDYSGWFVQYRVDLDAVTIAFPEMTRSYFWCVMVSGLEISYIFCCNDK